MANATDVEGRVREALERTGQPYEMLECDPDFADTAQFCERYAVPPANAGNTIIVASKKEPKQYCACVVQATARLDVNRKVAELMGVKKLSFASADETRELTGMMIGGVTVFALPEGLPIYVDEGVVSLDYVILGSGSRSSKVKASPQILRAIPGVEVVPGLGIPVG